jgi:hypothetical protein
MDVHVEFTYVSKMQADELFKRFFTVTVGDDGALHGKDAGEKAKGVAGKDEKEEGADDALVLALVRVHVKLNGVASRPTWTPQNRSISVSVLDHRRNFSNVELGEGCRSIYRVEEEQCSIVPRPETRVSLLGRVYHLIGTNTEDNHRRFVRSHAALGTCGIDC